MAKVNPDELDLELDEIESELKRLNNKLTDDSLKVLLKMSVEFKLELENTLSENKGSIFYIQRGQYGINNPTIE